VPRQFFIDDQVEAVNAGYAEQISHLFRPRRFFPASSPWGLEKKRRDLARSYAVKLARVARSQSDVAACSKPPRNALPVSANAPVHTQSLYSVGDIVWARQYGQRITSAFDVWVCPTLLTSRRRSTPCLRYQRVWRPS